MRKPAVYVLDSDVFIAAKNAYYAFDICPGFWHSVVQAHLRDRVRSTFARLRGRGDAHRV